MPERLPVEAIRLGAVILGLLLAEIEMEGPGQALRTPDPAKRTAPER